MESHNAALYGPYQPRPIVARDFTANDVTQLKTKLAELVTYLAHMFLSLSPPHVPLFVCVCQLSARRAEEFPLPEPDTFCLYNIRGN